MNPLIQLQLYNFRLLHRLLISNSVRTREQRLVHEKKSFVRHIGVDVTRATSLYRRGCKSQRQRRVSRSSVRRFTSDQSGSRLQDAQVHLESARTWAGWLGTETSADASTETCVDFLTMHRRKRAVDLTWIPKHREEVTSPPTVSYLTVFSNLNAHEFQKKLSGDFRKGSRMKAGKRRKIRRCKSNSGFDIIVPCVFYVFSVNQLALFLLKEFVWYFK